MTFELDCPWSIAFGKVSVEPEVSAERDGVDSLSGRKGQDFVQFNDMTGRVAEVELHRHRGRSSCHCICLQCSQKKLSQTSGRRKPMVCLMIQMHHSTFLSRGEFAS